MHLSPSMECHASPSQPLWVVWSSHTHGVCIARKIRRSQNKDRCPRSKERPRRGRPIPQQRNQTPYMTASGRKNRALLEAHDGTQRRRLGTLSATQSLIASHMLWFADAHSLCVILCSGGGENKRVINWDIKSNKGLTPHRKKEMRNGRVRLRNKYTKAMKKYSRMKPGVKSALNPVSYDGEASGINCNVVKSVKLIQK